MATEKGLWIEEFFEFLEGLGDQDPTTIAGENVGVITLALEVQNVFQWEVDGPVLQLKREHILRQSLKTKWIGKSRDIGPKILVEDGGLGERIGW